MSNNDVVLIELDRPRELRFRHSDMKKMEALTGKTIKEIDESIGLLSTENIETLVFVGLSKDAQENGETLTKEKVAELLDQSPYFSHSLEKAIQAWRVAFGLSATPEGNEQPPNQAAEIQTVEPDMIGTKA